MRPPRDALAALIAAALLPAPALAEPARAGRGGGLLDTEALGNRKDPITVTSDRLEYDYKANVVVYKGEVVATQGQVRLRSDTLTVAFDADGAQPAAKTQALEAGQGTHRLRDIVAVGGVRIDSGTRWATGGRAVFDQRKRTVVLTEDPVLHDGSNEVAGDRVVVYLDEDRSVVEGGRKRVKAVLYPGKDGGLAPAGGPTDARPGAETPAASADPTAKVTAP
jgi:lipopolysaccharide export system protein LptA